ncbi:GIY-YIG nuclease family protein [Salipiger bermudensis]|uniref:GIY-YIG nuclease family protein n=1 Tax=Salipiger bermudensis TaxID=344736 RepID=UPI001CD7EDE1|nr:GIY-YIG nuclease family protein [Salipiger bermudensis]MCA0961969.1 GIY-YIG nuclease family protein [Salipiger bermudensis]
MPGFAELEFDLPGALLTAILERLEGMDAADLTTANALTIPEEQGVYALYLKADNRLVYIGKTDSDAGLRHRLTRHARKIVGRRNIDPNDVAFKAIRLFVFTAMDLEAALIQHFGGVGAVAWNNSGFGSNDPGRKRDTSDYKADHFDAQYPIELDEEFVAFEPGDYPVAEIMQRLKDGLPYTLRFQRPGRKSYHADFTNTVVTIAQPGMTAREVLALCGRNLPAGWHITALPSHIISYKGDRNVYDHGHEIART